MKAVRVHAVGGPEVLQYEDVPLTAPGAGQAQVKVEAIGLNFIDCYFRAGLQISWRSVPPALSG